MYDEEFAYIGPQNMRTKRSEETPSREERELTRFRCLVDLMVKRHAMGHRGKKLISAFFISMDEFWKQSKEGEVCESTSSEWALDSPNMILLSI